MAETLTMNLGVNLDSLPRIIKSFSLEFSRKGANTVTRAQHTNKRKTTVQIDTNMSS